MILSFGGNGMAYTIKELEEMSTERLIGILVISSGSTTKATKSTEEKVFKILEKRNVIEYKAMQT